MVFNNKTTIESLETPGFVGFQNGEEEEFSIEVRSLKSVNIYNMGIAENWRHVMGK